MEPDTELSFVDATRMFTNNVYSAKYSKPKFTVGDIVVLKTGTAPQRVVAVSPNNNMIRCEYLNSRKQLEFRSVNDFDEYEYVTPYLEEKEFNMKDKLFKTLDTNRFGIGLAVDSDGKYVLKMQDNSNFESFEVANLKRVMPYTFDVEFVTGGNGRSNKYSYRGREGDVEVGDLLILEESFSIARVVAVNTESENATKTFKGAKLVTKAIG